MFRFPGGKTRDGRRYRRVPKIGKKENTGNIRCGSKKKRETRAVLTEN